MIKLIFSVFNLILLFIALLRFRRDMRWELRSGINCYNCKDFIGIEKKPSLVEDFRLCSSCERDRKIRIVKNFLSIDTISCKKYFLSRKFGNIQWYMLVVMLILLASDLFLSIKYDYELVGYISTGFNTIFYLLWIYVINISTQPKNKKPSQ